MTTNVFLILFLSFFLAEFLLNWVLCMLNEKAAHQNKSIPVFFKGRVEELSYQKSRQYTLIKLKYERWQLLFSSSITLALLFSGLLSWLDTLLQKAGTGVLTRGVLFFFILFGLLGILKYPIGLYETFKIEARFGFNKTTLGLYMLDTLKSLALSIIIGVPFLYVVLWFMHYSGSAWWLWAYAFITVFQVLMLVLYPAFIAPLFNKFKALDEGPLKAKLLDCARKADFPVEGIYIMDGSRRSTHSNAYFTGFGKLRRIVVFDTLVEQMSIDEMESIVYHEIGHYKNGHIYKMLLVNTVITGLVLFILSRAITWPPLYQAFGLYGSPSNLVHAGLFLFLTVFSTFSFLLAPLFNFKSRQYEYEADAFALQHNTVKASMETSLFNLARKNLTNITPHRWYSAYHYSHPTLYERVSALRRVQGV